MKYLFIIISTLFVFNLSAQQADATYLKIHKTYVLNEDGSYDYTYTHQLKYQSYISVHRKYGETFVVYDPDYQSVEVKECKTTMRDGKVVKAPHNAFNEVLPRFAEHSGSYNHLRELVITHTALEVGAVVDLTYVTHSKIMPAGFLSGKESLVYSSPVKELTLTFIVPEHAELNFGGNQGQKVYNENGSQKVYTFIYKNLPASVKQKRAGGNAAQILYFNQGKSFEKQLYALIHSKIKPENFNKEFTGATEENTDEILRAQRKIVEEMRTIHVPLNFQKLPVPSIEAIKLNNSGTLIEKALLLRQNLWDMKVNANIAFEIPIEQFNAKISNLENISNIYVMVPGKSDPLLLTVDNIPSANPLFSNYDKAIIILNGDGKLERLGPQNMNYANLDLSISIGIDNSEVTYKGFARGIFAGWLRTKIDASERLTNYIKEIESDVVIENQSAVKMSGKFKSEHTQYDGLLEVKLPLLKAGVYQFMRENLPQDQKYILDYSYPIEETYTYRVADDNNCKLIRTPDDFSVKNEYFEFRRKTVKKESETIVTQFVNIKSPVIPASQYEKMREALIQLSENTGRTLLFRCKN